jgi:hypothetical protein
MENEFPIDSQMPPHTKPTSSPEEIRQQRRILFAIIGIVILFLVLIVGGIIALVQPTTDTAKVRDIFIILMSFETLLIGLVLVVLIIQISRLINLIQNEIRPILDSTNETLNTLRGTTSFLSENLTEPVIKMNEYLAALRQVFQIVNLGKGRKKSNNK